MPKAKFPNWSGDPGNCPFCKNGEFPHSHNPDDEAPAAEPEQPAKPRKRAPKAQTADPTVPRRRGRPMSPENALLLKVCDCKKTPALSSV